MNTIKSYFFDFSYDIWKGVVVNFFSSVLSCAFYFFSLYFVTVLHFSMSITGYIIAFYSVGTIIGGVLGGELSDKFSSKSTTIAGLLLQAIGYFILPIWHFPLFLMFIAGGIGCANYLSITGLYTMLLHFCQHDERKKTKVLGLLAIMSNLGLGISALLIGYFAQYSFLHIFLLVGLFLVFLAAFVCFFTSPLNDEFLNTTNNEPFNKKQRRILLPIALICVFLGGAIVMQYSTTYNIYIRETFSSYGVRGVSYLFALNCILVVLLQPFVSQVCQNKNKVFLVGMGALLQGTSLLMLVFYKNYFYAMLAIFISTLGEVIFFPSVQLVCHQVSPNQKKGRGLGFYRAIYGASRAFGSSVGGVIYTHKGPNMLWCIVGFIGFICFMICYRCKKYWS